MNKKEAFNLMWQKIEEGQLLTLEVIDGLAKVLFKDPDGKYRIKVRSREEGETVQNEREISRDSARAEIHAMVARMADEERFKGEEQ